MKRRKQAMAIGLVLAAVVLTVLFGFNEARAGDADAGYQNTSSSTLYRGYSTAGGERGQAGVGSPEAATATAPNASRSGSAAAAVNGEKTMLLACGGGGNCKTISVDELFQTGLAFAAGSEVRGQKTADGDPADAPRNAGDAPGKAPGKAQASPGGKMMLACPGGGNCDTIPVKELLGNEIRLACWSPKCKSTSTSELLGDEVRLTMRLPETAAGATVGTGATVSAGATGQAKLARAESTTHGLASPPPTTSTFTRGLHGETTTYGFAPARQASPATKAFAAGLFAAREILSGDKNPQPMPEALAPAKAAVASNETRRAAAAWLQSDQSDYFRCGWWAMNLLAICHFDAATPDQFWTYQVYSLENISKTFAGLPGPEARLILETVHALDRPIQALARDPDNRRAAAAVETELEQLTKRLSPEAA